MTVDDCGSCLEEVVNLDNIDTSIDADIDIPDDPEDINIDIDPQSNQPILQDQDQLAIDEEDLADIYDIDL